MGLIDTIAIKFAAARLRRLLEGKKTYVAGAGLIGMGVYMVSEGNVEAGLEKILEGAGLMFLRAGVAKAAV